MKTVKKIVCILLVVVMCLTSAPLQGFVGLEWPDLSALFTTKTSAATAYTNGVYIYTVSDGKATITGCDTSISGDIVIPDTLGGHPVTSIGFGAFEGCTSLTSITIPDSVTSIGTYAFRACTSLTSITIPDSVTSIGDSAFDNCTSLTSITIPYSVTSIGKYAFEDCTCLTSITIPDSVTSIGYAAFRHCDSLTSITIPDSVTEIGEETFRYCTSLTSVTIGNGVTRIGYCEFYNCDSLTSITIPDSVTSIGTHAFRDCTSLTSVTIGNSVTSIGDVAFYNCDSLTSITIPDSVTSIGTHAFDDCTSLTSVIIGNSVTSIAGYAFFSCKSLTSITIPDSVTSIGSAAFGYCSNLKDVYYTGTEAQWEAISIGRDNECLTNATIHYNSSGTAQIENKVYTGKFYSEKYIYGGTDNYEGYRYTDDYFIGDNDVYNHDLAKMSLCVAMSAFNSKDSVKGTYYENQDINIKYILNEIGYDVKTYYYDEKPSSDSIAFAIGQKDIVIENENYTVIAIAVRGAGYEAEWGGNFRVGTGVDHRGFTLAKNKVISKLKEYLSTTQVNHKVKFWLTGYSRAAATANLTAAEIIESGIGGATASDVYAYTFETPQNTRYKQAKSSKYDGIHNIINPIDFVPKVAMTAWGYTRYGTDYFIPVAETSKRYNNLFKAMKTTYKNINKFDCPYEFEPKTLEVGFVTTKIVKDKYSLMQQTRFLDRFFDNLAYNTIRTPEQYSENLEKNLVKIISDLYVNEDDVNDFISGFKDVLIDFVLSHKMKVAEYLIKGVVAGNSTIIKLLLNDEAIMEDFKKDIAEYMTSTKYLNITYSEAKSFVEDCEEIIHFLGVYEFDSVLTLICNFETAIAESHQPRLCLSWMNTLKSEADFKVGTYKLFVYDCPVDVSVYDSNGNLVAAIINDVPVELEESELSYYINSDGEKVFCLPNDDEYHIVIEATDDGTLSCSVSETSIESFKPISRICYNDISIKKGDLLEQELLNDLDNEKEYSLTHNSQQVESTDTYVGDELVEYDVTIKTFGDGKAVGSGKRTVGSYAQLTALSSTCSKFEGWYVEEQCVSTDEVYRFRVESDIEVFAKFSEKIYHSLGDWCEVTPASCETIGVKRRNCSECDYFETQEVLANGHTDTDQDGKCDSCGKDMTENCPCHCHKSGIVKFFFNIILFFQRIFKQNKMCACGVNHY